MNSASGFHYTPNHQHQLQLHGYFELIKFTMGRFVTVPCIAVLLLLLAPDDTSAYTSRRKKFVVSPHQPPDVNHAPVQSGEVPLNKSEEHRRLGEEKTAAAASDTKTNMAPTIQQLKGTVIKDNMNRGFPLESEISLLFTWCNRISSLFEAFS